MANATMLDNGDECPVTEVLLREADTLEFYARNLWKMIQLGGVVIDGEHYGSGDVQHNMERAIEAMRNAAAALYSVID